MHWLQWSTIDLKNGIGGVEAHARSLARELTQLGNQCTFSSDASDLYDPQWDVIHTHGSAPAPQGHSKAIRVHTLHGTTLGRMAACGEWTWPGGYAAATRELRGILCADVILSVHPNLSLYHLAKKLGKTHAVCWNGWDSANLTEKSESAPEPWKQAIPPSGTFWVFVGRGADYTKGADRLKRATQLLPDLKWVAAPGEGFEDCTEVIKTGRLDSNQVGELMAEAAGLVLPSRYEGHSLVLLEALSQGVPVVATKVGGVPVLPEGLQGLVTVDSADPRAIADAIRAASRFSIDSASRSQRAQTNQSLLPRWKNVAEISLNAVQRFQSQGRKL